MIHYVTLGVNELERAVRFYDRLLGKMGAVRAFDNESTAAWSFEEGGSLLFVTKPFDEKSATAGNGVMVALNVENADVVDKLHAEALDLGAESEGAPGLRESGFYAGYFRDPDGNKLNFFCHQ